MRYSPETLRAASKVALERAAHWTATSERLLAQAGVTEGGDAKAGSVAEGDSTRSEGCAQ